jgi:alpha-L-fucosidase
MIMKLKLKLPKRSMHKIMLILLMAIQFKIYAQKYASTWESVNKHEPAPEWFQDAKFGIYFHWGVYSVPAFGTEWYPSLIYSTTSYKMFNDHHILTYGTLTEFPYDKFITGGYNKAGQWVQFAPKLKSQGGNFDPDEWAQLFSDAGARFAGPSAEHHDGFSMWNSSANEWNSVKLGPKLDLLDLFAKAVRSKNMKLLVALHTTGHIKVYWKNAPIQATSSLQKLYAQLPLDQERQLWFDKLKEVIDGYQPDIIWQDWDLDIVDEKRKLDFLSYYFNKGIEWNKQVVSTCKKGDEGGFGIQNSVADFERGGPAVIEYPYWLTDDAVGSNGIPGGAPSWCYIEGLKYYSTVAMLHTLIDKVSKNGNLLLNISPRSDGTIPEEQKSILLGIGGWLKKFGDAIYSTRAWLIYGEGPTIMGGGAFTTPVKGTNADIRFTRNKQNNTLYAIVLGWPGNQLNIATLKSGNFNLIRLKSVQLLGEKPGEYIDLPSRKQDGTGFKIKMPSQPYSALAYVVKLTFEGEIPQK